MVTDRYLHVHHHPDVASFAGWLTARRVRVVGVDNLPGAVPLETAGCRSGSAWCSAPRGPG